MLRLALILLPIFAIAGCSGEGITRYTYNIGSNCEIATVDPSALRHTLTTQEAGLFQVFSDGSKCILLTAPATPATWQFAHEYTHDILWDLRGYPDAQRIVMHTFRELMAPNFEIGHDDLMEEAP